METEPCDKRQKFLEESVRDILVNNFYSEYSMA